MKTISLAVAALISSAYAVSVIPRSSQEQQQQSLVEAGHGHSDDSDDEEKKPSAPDHPIEQVNDVGKPQITFSSPYDHEGHGSGLLDQESSSIGFKRTKQTHGPYCMEDDWVVLRYKMWSQLDGQLLEDTDSTPNKEPKIALIGRYELPKCLDIAIQQMKQGEEATVKCPNYLDLGGGGTKNNWRPLISQHWLNSKIDTKYTLSVQECNRKPLYFKQDDHIESLTEGYPFYFESYHKNADGHEMCLEVDPVDLYAPRKTGVHNIKLQKCSGKEHPNIYQQFMWNQEQTSLTSVGVPGSALFEGFNRNIITYKWKGLHNQRFKYNIGTKRFENRFTGFAMDIKNDKIVAGQNLLTNEPDNTIGQQWKIEYQSEDHGHDHEH